MGAMSGLHSVMSLLALSTTAYSAMSVCNQKRVRRIATSSFILVWMPAAFPNAHRAASASNQRVGERDKQSNSTQIFVLSLRFRFMFMAILWHGLPRIARTVRNQAGLPGLLFFYFWGE